MADRKSLFKKVTDFLSGESLLRSPEMEALRDPEIVKWEKEQRLRKKLKANNKAKNKKDK